MPLNHALLRDLRKRRRLTQVELSQKAGITEQYVVRLESASKAANPTIEVVEAIAKALGTTAAKLIEEKP